MVNHHIGIDNIGIKVVSYEALEQRIISEELMDYIDEKYNLKYKKRYTRFASIEQQRYYKRRILFGIVTGCYRIKNPYGIGFIFQYYINIKFAGLKSYNEDLDKLTKNILYSVFAFLHTREIDYTITSTDIYIDMMCPFENILGLCVKKAPSVNYYELNKEQEKINLNYIEEIQKKNWNLATQRAYWYDKGKKAELSYSLTRFELKLQPKYFYRYGFNIESIQMALNRYYILYFKNIKEKQEIIDKYENYKHIANREIKRLKLNKYKLEFDILTIKKFFAWLDSAYDEELGNNFDKKRYSNFKSLFN